MRNSVIFLNALLDSLSEQIAVIDASGKIIYVNEAWWKFGLENGGNNFPWVGLNYMNVFETEEDQIRGCIASTKEGIEAVIQGGKEEFRTEYPCDSPEKRRWFLMRISRLQYALSQCFIVSHTEITDRKDAEEDVQRLSMSDPLTGLANRRHFSQFLNKQWLSAIRNGNSISLILIDIDHFKSVNDTYGHMAGDECLCIVAQVLTKYARRSGDLVARYGGEEFALILTETSVDDAVALAESIRAEVTTLQLDVISGRRVTISCGVNGGVPKQRDGEKNLIAGADEALYRAKEKGRNLVDFMRIF